MEEIFTVLLNKFLLINSKVLKELVIILFLYDKINHMSNLEFWMVQLIGIIAWLLIVFSYYRKNTDKILYFQIISTILWCIHYFLLGAYSGLFICVFEVIRDSLYYKTDKDDYIFLGSIPIYILYGIISYSGIVELLPIFSSTIDGFTLTKKKKIVVIGAVVSYTIWVIYDIAVKSYSGAFTDGIVVLSNISILLFDKGLFGDKNIKFK